MATKIISNTFALLDSDSEDDYSSSVINTPSITELYVAALKTKRFHLWSDYNADIFPCSSCPPWFALDDDHTWCCSHGTWTMVDSYPFLQANHPSSCCPGNCNIHPLTDSLILRFALDSLNGLTWGDTEHALEQERLSSLTDTQRRREAAELARKEALAQAKREEDARAYQQILAERAQAQKEHDAKKEAERNTAKPPLAPSYATRGWGSSTSSSPSSTPSNSRPHSGCGHRAPHLSNRIPGKIYLPGVAPYNGLPRTCQYAEEPAAYDAKKNIHYEAGCAYQKKGECKLFHLDELTPVQWAESKKATQEYLKARDEFRNSSGRY